MRFSHAGLTLLMLSAAVCLCEQQAQTQQSSGGPEEQSEPCSTCDVRQQIKSMRLNAIKSQILSKLRMKEAPNISRDVVKQLLPRAPPLQQLLDQYDVLGDDNRDAVVDEDDEHAVTETIMMMATERKWTPPPIIGIAFQSLGCLVVKRNVCFQMRRHH